MVGQHARITIPLMPARSPPISQSTFGIDALVVPDSASARDFSRSSHIRGRSRNVSPIPTFQQPTVAMDERREEETQPLTSSHDDHRRSEDRPETSTSSASTTSLALEHLSAKEALYGKKNDAPNEGFDDIEDSVRWKHQVKPADKKARRVLYILVAIGFVGWIAAGFLFASSNRNHLSSQTTPSPTASSAQDSTPSSTADSKPTKPTGKLQGGGKGVTLESVLTGQWSPKRHAISWIAGPDGEDGLLLERGQKGKDYLVVEDVRSQRENPTLEERQDVMSSKTLMKETTFTVGGKTVNPILTRVSPDHKQVLVLSDYKKNWRHSSTGLYWIFDVASQSGQPLDRSKPEGRVQLASWSPNSDAVVFTRDNNMYIRHLSRTRDDVEQITTDGGPELFYGVPDWVFEEEVFGSDTATWWSQDGAYIAFLRTNESAVPDYPVQYFFSSPTGQERTGWESRYPEVRNIKYPKAGAPMSVVSLQYYDVSKGETFSVPINNDFPDDDRLITEVVPCGHTGDMLVKETNRESDVEKVVLVDVARRTGQTVRETDVKSIDGGWFEVSESTTFVPSDPANGRMHAGYIDTVIQEGNDHLAYFTPLDNPKPVMLTQGNWEVVKAPSAVDTENNFVYFLSTQASSLQRQVYSIRLPTRDNVEAELSSPEEPLAVTDANNEGYYDLSFSTGSGYGLLTYSGPNIPYQKIIQIFPERATYANQQKVNDISTIEKNDALKELVSKTEMPKVLHQMIRVDGFELNLMEYRPPHFDPKKKYPVLFFLYNGPGFQLVDKRFSVDFSSYVASTLGYIVVSLDGRGSGFLGRKTRTIVRGNIGYWEAHDQIVAAKMWAAKPYVDGERMAIWGWSYGGFMTLKTLEQDAGETFKYGMSVAPVTDWRFYDSIYTERYMYTPQHNPGGYDNSSISNMTSLMQNVRFLVMHGVSDDNVHYQNTLQLLDHLDQANARNYDVHFFPDSDHSIGFHNANRVVYEKLSDWLVNAFNGEWLRTDNPTPQLEG